MNSWERIQQVLQRKKPDVLPVAPYMGNHGAAVAGVRLIDYYTRPDQMANAQYQAWKIYGQDMVCIQSDNYYIAEGFGMKAEYFENSTPVCVEPAISELKDVSRLKVPDPYRDGRMPVYIGATERIRSQIKNQVAIRCAGTGPFALAGHLFGTEKLLLAIADLEYGLGDTDEPALHGLLELCTQALFEFSKACLEAGADIVQCGDSLASLDVISPEIYRKYAFPYEKKYFDAINPLARQHQAWSLLHICGNNTKVMDLQARTGADILEIDHKADLAVWKEKVGGQAILMGNLDPTGVLLQGSVADVRLASQHCIQDAAAGGGFILGSGCEVPILTPAGNIKEMIRTARNFRYSDNADPVGDRK